MVKHCFPCGVAEDHTSKHPSLVNAGMAKVVNDGVLQRTKSWDDAAAKNLDPSLPYSVVETSSADPGEPGQVAKAMSGLILLGVLLLVGWGLVSCFNAIGSGEDDCYTTGDVGSAQYDRDVQRCIEGGR